MDIIYIFLCVIFDYYVKNMGRVILYDWLLESHFPSEGCIFTLSHARYIEFAHGGNCFFYSELDGAVFACAFLGKRSFARCVKRTGSIP